MHEPEKATEKSKDLVRMAVGKARLLGPLQKMLVPVIKSALVIGGGLSGMTSALELANQGFNVYLVEKEKELGGNLRRIHYLVTGENPQDELKKLIEKVKKAEKIHLYTEAKIENFEGSIGNFKTTIATNGKSIEFEHGVVIVATGAQEYKPKEYLYGQHERVLTQLELEQRLSTNGNWLETDKNQKPRNIVMIQCVGSRDDERPYCSRVCCTEAVKNALKIKELSPETNVYILYRDVRTYGFSESYYTKARQQGVIFMRYDEDRKPEVTQNGNGLQVKIFDLTLKTTIEIPADLVVLSTGIVADEGNEEISKLLKVPLNTDGFFLEAHMKLRPVDFSTDGVFLAGLAHSPKMISESIAQAQAAACRAAAILSKDEYETEATISSVNEEICSGCGTCVEVCEFDTLELVETPEGRTVCKVNQAVCKGCGCCAAACPSGAIEQNGFRRDQILSAVDAATAWGENSG